MTRALVSVDPDDATTYLRELNRVIFPDDAEPCWHGAEWTVAFLSGMPVAFCGWKPILPMDGMLLRAGVLESARGHGLQATMIEHREERMRRVGLEASVTYTETHSLASMNTLIGCGYRVCDPDPRICGAHKTQRMVFWRREL